MEVQITVTKCEIRHLEQLIRIKMGTSKHLLHQPDLHNILFV